MPVSRKSQGLESRIERLKERSRTKQQLLERMLAASPKTSSAGVRRQHWIHDALHRIKRAKAQALYRATILDAYTEHLSVLELTLMGAAEENTKDTKVGHEGREE
jgi:hypothetical protein